MLNIMDRAAPTAMLLIVGAVILSCHQEDSSGKDGATDASTPASKAAQSPGKITKVDILVVMEKSPFMNVDQTKLAAQIPALVKALGTGDIDGDGTKDMEPVESLHLGVISGDMGLPGLDRSESANPGCTQSGDDGVLLTRPREDAAPECADSYPAFLTYTSGQDDPDQIGLDFGCKLQAGPKVCGIEQHLEAVLKALWPSEDQTVTFLTGRGHGDVENKGFLREDSLLAILVVTDEDDCSAGAQGNLDFWKKPNSTGLPEWLASDPEKAQKAVMRCYYDSLLPEAEQDLWPVERYTKNLRALRPKGMQDRIIFGVIAGVPVELVNGSSGLPEQLLGNIHADSGEVTEYYEKILDDPAMRQKEAEDSLGFLALSCKLNNSDYDPDQQQSASNYPTIAEGEPAQRLVATVKEFGVNGVVRSICEETYTDPVHTLLTAIANRIKASKTN